MSHPADFSRQLLIYLGLVLLVSNLVLVPASFWSPVFSAVILGLEAAAATMGLFASLSMTRFPASDAISLAGAFLIQHQIILSVPPLAVSFPQLWHVSLAVWLACEIFLLVIGAAWA